MCLSVFVFVWAATLHHLLPSLPLSTASIYPTSHASLFPLHYALAFSPSFPPVPPLPPASFFFGPLSFCSTSRQPVKSYLSPVTHTFVHLSLSLSLLVPQTSVFPIRIHAVLCPLSPSLPLPIPTFPLSAPPDLNISLFYCPSFSLHFKPLLQSTHTLHLTFLPSFSSTLSPPSLSIHPLLALPPSLTHHPPYHHRSAAPPAQLSRSADSAPPGT